MGAFGGGLMPPHFQGFSQGFFQGFWRILRQWTAMEVNDLDCLAAIPVGGGERGGGGGEGGGERGGGGEEGGGAPEFCFCRFCQD